MIEHPTRHFVGARRSLHARCASGLNGRRYSNPTKIRGCTWAQAAILLELQLNNWR
jgi:hypothetical protein